MVLTNTYANGQLYEHGFPFEPSIDLWFREGIVSVPEPSTLALVGLSSLLAYIFKRRSKLSILFLIGTLFAISVLPGYSVPDSVVQATADAAGLTPVTATALPRMGTFWVMTPGPRGNLTALPYPSLPASMDALPIYSVANGIFIVDNTGGQLVPSSVGRLSTALAASTAHAQAQIVANLIEQIQSPNEGTNELQSNGSRRCWTPPACGWKPQMKSPGLGCACTTPSATITNCFPPPI